MGVRRSAPDSDAVRSGRVPNLNMRSLSVAFWHSGGTEDFRLTKLPKMTGLSRDWYLTSGTPQAPADHSRFNDAAGLDVAPFAVDPAAGERQLISAAVILAQHLNRLIRRRFAVAIEFGQTSFAR